MSRVLWVSQVTLQLVISFTLRPVLAGGTELLIESAGKKPCRRRVGIRVQTGDHHRGCHLPFPHVSSGSCSWKSKPANALVSPPCA